MKKVLFVVVLLVLLGGLIVGSMWWSGMQTKQDIAGLSKFEMPVDFSPLLLQENLKKDKAPIYDFKAKGADVVPSMLKVLREPSNPENVKCAALIILCHLAHKDAMDDAIEALKTVEGRIGECASVFLCLFWQDEIAEKIRKVASDTKLDKKVRLSAYNAMYGWSSIKLKKESEKLKRKKNKNLKALTIEGLKETDIDFRKVSVKMVKEVALDMEAAEGAKSEVHEVAMQFFPFLESEDAAFVADSFATLQILIGNMQHPLAILAEILKLAKAPKKEQRLMGLTLVELAFKHEDSDISKEKEIEKVHTLLEDPEKEIVLKAIAIMKDNGKSTEDRLALKPLTESQDKDIAEAAKAAQEKLAGKK